MFALVRRPGASLFRLMSEAHSLSSLQTESYRELHTIVFSRLH